MTEGNGHIIDPDGQARRALQAAVAERGPQVLSDPATLDGIGRDRLDSLPGEYIIPADSALAIEHQIAATGRCRIFISGVVYGSRWGQQPWP